MAGPFSFCLGLTREKGLEDTFGTPDTQGKKTLLQIVFFCVILVVKEGVDIVSLNDIMATLKKVYEKYADIRVGIAGSYVNGTQHANSDIDVVVDGDSMRVDIMEYIKSQFPTEVDVLWVELMKQEDEEMDRFALENDLPINEYSVYKTVMQEVMWV